MDHFTKRTMVALEKLIELVQNSDLEIIAPNIGKLASHLDGEFFALRVIEPNIEKQRHFLSVPGFLSEIREAEHILTQISQDDELCKLLLKRSKATSKKGKVEQPYIIYTIDDIKNAAAELSALVQEPIFSLESTNYNPQGLQDSISRTYRDELKQMKKNIALSQKK